jgi:DNA repair exonuclease SbcCD ATPase subunit
MMKLSSALFILFVLSVSGAAYKIHTLKGEISDLTRKIGALTSDLNTMKAEEKSSTAEKRKNKMKIRSHRQALIAKKLKRAKLKLAKVPAELILGTGVTTAAFTANDIHDYCQDVKEFRELEASLYGASEDEISEDEKKLCEYDVKKEFLPVLKNYSDDSADWIKEHYHDIRDDADKLIDKWF